MLLMLSVDCGRGVITSNKEEKLFATSVRMSALLLTPSTFLLFSTIRLS